MQVLIEVLWVNANSFELSRSVTFTQTLWAVYTLRSVTVRRLKCELGPYLHFKTQLLSAPALFHYIRLFSDYLFASGRFF